MGQSSGTAEVLARRRVRHLLKDLKRGLRKSFKEIFAEALRRAIERTMLERNHDLFADSFWVRRKVSKTKTIQFLVSFLFLPAHSILIITDINQFEKALEDVTSAELDELQRRGFL